MNKKIFKLTTFLILLVFLLSLSTHPLAVVIDPLPPIATKINLLGIIHSDGGDRTSWHSTASAYLENIDPSTINSYTAFDSEEIWSILSASDIFVIHTHGAQNAMMAVDENGSESFLYRSQIEAKSDISLTGVDLAYIGACSCGAGGASASNVVCSLYDKGAECVIGYRYDVLSAANYIMLLEFCKAIGYGYTISEALAYADTQVLLQYGSSGNTSDRLTLGDTTQSFAEESMIVSIEENTVLSSNTNVTQERVLQLSNNGDDVGFFDLSKLQIAVQTSYINTNFAPNVENSDLIDLEKYSLETQYFVEDTGIWTTIYRYSICGLATSDAVMVMHNNQGDLVGIIRPNEGAFDQVTLTSTDIDQARNTLQTVLRLQNITEFSVVNSMLVCEDGMFYVRYSVECQSGETNSCSDVINDFMIPV